MSIHRRSVLSATALAVAAFATTGSAWAQAEDIVLGGSIPMTGVFAFAGIGVNAGIQDYVKIVNDAGGTTGRKRRSVPEDTGYKGAASGAAFKTITSPHTPPPTRFVTTSRSTLNGISLSSDSRMIARMIENGTSSPIVHDMSVSQPLPESSVLMISRLIGSQIANAIAPATITHSMCRNAENNPRDAQIYPMTPMIAMTKR